MFNKNTSFNLCLIGKWKSVTELLCYGTDKYIIMYEFDITANLILENE